MLLAVDSHRFAGPCRACHEITRGFQHRDMLGETHRTVCVYARITLAGEMDITIGGGQQLV